MDVRYSKTWGVVLLVLGVVNLVLALILAGMGGSVVGPLVPGVVCVGISVAYFTRVYFTAGDDRIVIRALIGPLKRTFEGPFSVENGKVYALRGEGRRKVPVTRLLADKQGWNEFIESIRRGTLEREP